MWKMTLAIIATIVVGFLIVVSRKPDSFSISRSMKIEAPASVIYPHINDLHKMIVWDPWSKADPNIKIDYTGAPAGIGSVYTWKGNSDVGEGQLEIVENKEFEFIKMNLTFYKPMESENISLFILTPDGTGTMVTQTMSGPNKFMSKIIQTFMDMDKMIGSHFEKGLSDLKTITESEIKK